MLSHRPLICCNLFPRWVPRNAAAFCHFSWAGLSFTTRCDAFYRCTLLSQRDERDHFQQRLFCNLRIMLVQWQHGLHEEIAYRLFSTDDAFVILENSTNHYQSGLLRNSLGWREHEVHVRVGCAVRSQRVLTTIVSKEVDDAMCGDPCPFFVNRFLLGSVGGCDENQKQKCSYKRWCLSSDSPVR